ncbi:MAG: hypothetical protein GX421_09390 [Caldisericales bacterium]|nr:hypothetical protein [Caldisericales bacterium]
MVLQWWQLPLSESRQEQSCGLELQYRVPLRFLRVGVLAAGILVSGFFLRDLTLVSNPDGFSAAGGKNIFVSADKLIFTD